LTILFHDGSIINHPRDRSGGYHRDDVLDRRIDPLDQREEEMRTWMGAVAIFFVAMYGNAGNLTWMTPYGTFNLDLQTTEAVLGYDGILRQAIGGASVPVYTDPKGIAALQIGAIAPWPNASGVAVEPYVAVGHDIAKEIPFLAQYHNLHLNAFGRYAATQGGRFGAGASIAYSFGGAEPVPVASPAVVVNQ
jgi:hypothetical protein